MKTARLLAALFTIMLGPRFVLAGTTTNELVVTVSGAKAGRGQLLLSMFTSADNYLVEPQHSESKAVDESGGARFRISGLPGGEYVVSIVYDEDMNQELNTGLFGIPTEMIGFSNNVSSSWGPPPYDDVSFTVPETSEITIHLGSAKQSPGKP